MSATFLIRAALGVLRTELDWDNSNSGIRGQGRPPFFAGDHYVGIFPHQWDPGEINQNPSDGVVDEVMGFTAVVTRRIGSIPNDQLSEEAYLEVSEGIGKRAELVRKVLLANRGTVCDNAAELFTNKSDKITEPYYWAGGDPEPVLVGAEWFSADPQDEQAVGFTMSLRFEGARRIQYFNRME